VADGKGDGGMSARGLTVGLWALGLAGVALLAWVVVGLVAAAAPLLSSGAWAREAAVLGPLLANTVYMVAAALAVSVPLGLAAAVWRTEYAAGTRGRWLEAAADLLASLPTVVVGLGLFLLLIDAWHLPLSRLTGMVALVVINWPWVAAAAATVLQQAPDALREASLALGATPFATAYRVVIPRVLPGLVGVITLGTARLLGEAAALLYTAGLNASSDAGWNLLAPGGTLAVHLFYVRTEGAPPHAAAQAAVTGVLLLAVVGAVLALGRTAMAAVGRRAGTAPSDRRW
jgi:phosphate transport system permease protein